MTPCATLWHERTASAASSRTTTSKVRGRPRGRLQGNGFQAQPRLPGPVTARGRLPLAENPVQKRRPGRSAGLFAGAAGYGLQGNIEVDFYVQDNKTRKWYGMPWMDWNTEVASDWPGTDGREFVHGLTHEFDSEGNTFGAAQLEFVDTWAQAYVNDRYAFSVGQVFCDPGNPDPGALNPDKTGLNSMPNGAYVIKLLFSTVSESELPTVKGAFEWDADIFVHKSPRYRNEGPLSRYERKIGKVRLIQIDLQVRDDRSLPGWLLGTYGYDGNAKGDTPWKRMVPLGLQWGNNPTVTFSETCSGPSGPCTYDKLTEQWI